MFKRLKSMFFDRQQINIEVYRCDGCKGLITSFDIARLNRVKEGDICKCGVNQLRPINPSLWEKIIILTRYVFRGY